MLNIVSQFYNNFNNLCKFNKNLCYQLNIFSLQNSFSKNCACSFVKLLFTTANFNNDFIFSHFIHLE